ncbi:MAG: hypothetical protein NUW21_08200, partial [Elusimicrobia bacterium]|nr:hypothetical protein [Elusimicrobiota bacterium]
LAGGLAAQEAVPAPPPSVSVAPLPVPPLLVKPMPGQPVRVEPLPDPRTGARTAPSTTLNIATAPAVVPLIAPGPAPAPPPPVLGTEISSKLRADEEHFNDKIKLARREFDLRQAEERKAFEAAPPGAGFWERRRLGRKFRAAQERGRREFVAEQENKRKTYEWRYP